jgi:hypothetical protein
MSGYGVPGIPGRSGATPRDSEHDLERAQDRHEQEAAAKQDSARVPWWKRIFGHPKS